jgi:hypothetical protein
MGSTIKDLREIFRKEFDVESKNMILKLKTGEELNNIEQLNALG